MSAGGATVGTIGRDLLLGSLLLTGGWDAGTALGFGGCGFGGGGRDRLSFEEDGADDTVNPDRKVWPLWTDGVVRAADVARRGALVVLVCLVLNNWRPSSISLLLLSGVLF